MSDCSANAENNRRAATGLMPLPRLTWARRSSVILHPAQANLDARPASESALVSAGVSGRLATPLSLNLRRDPPSIFQEPATCGADQSDNSDETTDEQLNGYYKKLADFIHQAVKSHFA